MIDVEFWSDVASRWFGIKGNDKDSYSMVVRVIEGEPPKASIKDGLLDEKSDVFSQLHDFKL